MTETFRDLIQSDDELSDGERDDPRFFIDTSWYEQHGRSFRAMAQGRFCPSCHEKIGTRTEERIPTVEKKSNKLVYETREVPFGDQPMAVIRAHCSKERHYLTSETPLLESVFRVFLASGNQPATAERIREQLGDWISLRDRHHGYAPDLIERLIRSDRRYGLREFKLENP